MLLLALWMVFQGKRLVSGKSRLFQRHDYNYYRLLWWVQRIAEIRLQYVPQRLSPEHIKKYGYVVVGLGILFAAMSAFFILDVSWLHLLRWK
jgi:hypothetical protein